MDLRKTKQAISKKEIQDFEEKLEMKLPQFFIDFYLKNNGGIPSHRYFRSYRIASFTPLKYGRKENTIEFTIENLKIAKRLPKNYLPFAHDSGGWYFSIDLSENDYGAVYILPNGIGDLTPIFISPSFEDFITNLSLEDDY